MLDVLGMLSEFGELSTLGVLGELSELSVLGEFGVLGLASFAVAGALRRWIARWILLAHSPILTV
jgi:hypothetical protein